MGNAGAKLKRIEEEYRRRMEEEMDKNKKLFAELTATRDEMEKKGESVRAEEVHSFQIAVGPISVCLPVYLGVFLALCLIFDHFWAPSDPY